MKVSFIKNKVAYLWGIVATVAMILLFFASRGAKSIPKEKIIMERIATQQEIIKKYSRHFNVSPRMYVSILFGELYNNLNFYDEFDEVRANIGFDPSIGFSQIRVSTAYWLEENLTDTIVIKRSRNKNELIHKLISDESNIAYSICYVKLIQNTITKKGMSLSVGLIASYYGRGIDFGKDITDADYSNVIGKTAEKFYYSNKLIDVYPR